MQAFTTDMESKAGDTMSALIYNRHAKGDARNDVLDITEMEAPIPSPGEVLCHVLAFAINPVDIKLLENPLRGNPKLPHIPCLDFSGVVIDNERVKDSRFTVGDIVMGFMPSFIRNGCASSKVAIAEDYIVLIPRGFDPVKMASLPLVGSTVVQALEPYLQKMERDGGSPRGKKILITGACGGVGTFAVQYAKHLGFHVTGTCSSTHFSMAKSLKVDEVIDRAHGFTNNEKAQGMDVVLDAFSFENRVSVLDPGCGVLARSASYIDIASSPHALEHPDPLRLCIPEAAAPNLINAVFLRAWIALTNVYARLLGRSIRNWTYEGPKFVRPDGVTLRVVRKLAAQGIVNPVIDKVYPFTKSGCRAAFDRVAAAHCSGKVVVVMPTNRHVSRAASD